MHPVSREILERFQTRLRRSQKTRFIEWLKPRLEAEGYAVAIEESRDIAYSRNIVVGDIGRARYVFGAHYDTCALLPFPNFIAPKNLAVSVLAQLAIALPILIVASAMGLLMGLLGGVLLAGLGYLAVFFLLIYLMIAGVPSKTTANDNTSGVITLVECAMSLPKGLRSRVAFVFFDNEEKGLLGSSVFARRHRELMNSKTLINFDCVSDGDGIFLALKGSAKKDAALASALERAFLPGGDKRVSVERGLFMFPSDQAMFKKGVAVCALRHSRFLGHYMGRIHTTRDTVFDERNIELLRRGVERLLSQ